MENYDIAIIGAGWAGFNAALKAVELNQKVALIESSLVGGTCLNRGCIPTKCLVQSAKLYSLTKKSRGFGIDIAEAKINFPNIQKRKESVVASLREGMQFLLKNKNINYINSHAKLVSNNEIDIGNDKIRSKFIILASGSQAIELPGIKFDGKKIISSDDILNLKEIPKSLLIIGGGVIGCEFASIFSTLGSKVEIVEMASQLLPTEDKDVAKKLENSFKKKGIKVSLNTDATPIDLSNYDLALLAIGRKPQTYGLGLEAIGVKTEKGKIIVNQYLKTSVDNIFAAGDCIGTKLLAHVAAYQGRLAIENALGTPVAADLNVVPNCIFTEPQIASVGINTGDAVNVYKFDFQASGMARILDETDGFIKVVSDKKTDKVLGASIIGPLAVELIGVLTLAIKVGIKVGEIKQTIFAHPTLSEAIAEIS